VIHTITAPSSEGVVFFCPNSRTDRISICYRKSFMLLSLRMQKQPCEKTTGNRGHSRKPKPVVAFERWETYVFPSINDAAIAYGVNAKIICDRIEDGRTLKDGYTTLDWASTEADVIADFKDMRRTIRRKLHDIL